MKIVINRCYGGFGLSEKAIELYLTKKGYTFISEKGKYASLVGKDYFILTESGDYKSFYEDHIERNDPILVEVVEELGEKANGKHGNLEIEEISAGTLYRIKEYDGFESIEINYDIDWKVAT